MSISLGHAWQDLHKTPEKWMTILWLSVCNLIPIAGPMVMAGYLFRRFAKVRALGEDEDFNIDHFMDYLWAGVPPFLAGLVASLALIPVIIIMMVVMLGGMAAAAQTGSGAAMGGGMIVLGLLMFVVISIFYLFVIPIQLRAGLEQRFGAGFNMNFVKSFVAKEGFSLFKWYILLTLLVIPAIFIGYCALFVGAYVVIAVFTFIIWHLVFQHYDDFIEKGGEQVPFSDELLYGKSVMQGAAPRTPPPPRP